MQAGREASQVSVCGEVAPVGATGRGVHSCITTLAPGPLGPYARSSAGSSPLARGRCRQVAQGGLMASLRR